MNRRGWMPHAFSIELRKMISYRVDFWVNFFAGSLAEIAIAYFLWKAVYDHRGIDSLGGFTLRGMICYYLLASVIGRMIRGMEHGILAMDIYDGSLSRYLVYPLSFVEYKYIAYLAQFVTGLCQLVLASGCFVLFFGIPAEIQVTVPGVLMGVVACLFANFLYFTIACLVDLTAFWADNVWSLNVMLRFATFLLGGAMIPLNLFPASLQKAIYALPFAYMISFPIECMMGKVHFARFASGMGTVAFWGATFTAGLAWVWSRGTKQYTGVGM